MSICPRCTAHLSDDSRFCSACGAAVPGAPGAPAGPGSGDGATTPMETRPLPSSPPDQGSASASRIAGTGGRFIPGAMIAGRYRIVGLLGRGGMGEVYRADDLKLGQPVALKFLPPGLESNSARLERFLGEVRTALKVTHPNVCRVFDIGEVDGHHFISMEYVDGEDLASLLRRVGRLPHERAVPVARQICAGLAAAHDRGILHRDLKPANVMIDGRGQVRLTDFGLAGLAEAIGDDDITSGTPGYMAPEQLTGREVTVRSDVYALGLLLYELFTGRPVFEGASIDDYRRAHTESQPSSPSTIVEGLDSAVERTVLQCLEKEPDDRPPSALAVSAALPGGDPLAAALAAGETPSPELVAESGGEAGMRPGRAILVAICALVVALGGARWGGHLTVTNFLPLDKRPEVLVDRARTILADLGYVEETYADPVDQAWGLLTWNDIFDEVAEADSSGTRWEGLRKRPDAGAFWFRQSPAMMQPEPQYPPIFTRGAVQLMNPTPGTPGEAMVLLNLDGTLRRFEVLPKRFSTREPVEPDWAPLFAAAGLDTARFTPDRPRYQRFMAPDVRRAWVGTRTDRPDLELRVEAGAFEGRPVLFNVATSASLESLSGDPGPNRPHFGWIMDSTVVPLLILVIAASGALFSRRNLQHGRADRRGAVRFAMIAFAMFMLAQGLRAHLLGTAGWGGAIWPLIVGGTFLGFISWASYSAAEPLGRRVWPTMFVSSGRLLSRPKMRWRDPVIGMSVLAGVLAGGVRMILVGPVRWHLRTWVEGEPFWPMGYNVEMMRGHREAASYVFDAALMFGFVMIMVVALIGIHMLVKRRVPSLILALAVWLALSGVSDWWDLTFNLMGLAIAMIVLLRWGVLAFFLAYYMTAMVYMARAVDYSAWWAQGPRIALAVIIALVAYGTWAAIVPSRTKP